MNWQKKANNETLASNLITEFNLPPLVASLFGKRGIDTADKIDFWLNADIEQLADPFLFNEMDKAVSRINGAIDSGELITVYGDYDADGITSTTILVETLLVLGANVNYYIPDRFKDGYGPSQAKYDELVAAGTKLLITVDNGITGHTEITNLKEKGVDVIVTDHHTLPDVLPNDAIAIIHPKLAGQQYPFHDFSGVGVAYCLCRAIMDGDLMEDLLDLVAIGTIADLVPLTGENHLLVKAGLEVIKQQNRPGLAALLTLAKLNLNHLNATDISFGIAPRLNSVGRIADANLAVKLLLNDEENFDQLDEIAQELDQDNTLRKQISDKVFQSALKQVEAKDLAKHHTLVLFDENFHEGVLGIVANRLVKELNKPTIVLTTDDHGLVKGSGRSVVGFDIFKALQPLTGNVLTKFGGHTMACGLSLLPENLGKLTEVFEESFSLPKEEPVSEYDMEIAVDQINQDEIQSLQLAGPFGQDNPEPIFMINKPQLVGFKRIGRNQEFFRFDLVQGNNKKIAVVNFSLGRLDEALIPLIEKMYCTLSLNGWNNNVTPQLVIEDFAYSAVKVKQPVVDLRKEPKILNLADKYLFYHEDFAQNFIQEKQMDPAKVMLIEDVGGEIPKGALMELPSSPAKLREIFGQYHFEQVYLKFTYDNLLVTEIPNEADFRKVLKYVYQHPNLGFEDYKVVTEYLKTNENALKFIFNVFLDLNFVKIDKSKIAPIKNAQQTPLASSKYLQATRQRLLFKQQLQSMPSAQLVDYIASLMN